jgi:hypothetical protein
MRDRNTVLRRVPRMENWKKTHAAVLRGVYFLKVNITLNWGTHWLVGRAVDGAENRGGRSVDRGVYCNLL